MGASTRGETDRGFSHGSAWPALPVPVPATGEIALASDTAALRRLFHARQRVDLVAVKEAGERVIASYTFNHSPSNG